MSLCYYSVITFPLFIHKSEKIPADVYGIHGVPFIDWNLLNDWNTEFQTLFSSSAKYKGLFDQTSIHMSSEL
jgi:hypothetical protein